MHCQCFARPLRNNVNSKQPLRDMLQPLTHLPINYLMYQVIFLCIASIALFIYLVRNYGDPTRYVAKPPRVWRIQQIYIPIKKTAANDLYEVSYDPGEWLTVEGKDIVASLIFHQQPVPAMLQQYIPEGLHVEIGNDGLISSIKV
jgi:hypothetical protein